MALHIVDARGLQCPGPIVEVFKTVKGAAAGDVLQVEATDKGFLEDITAWCKKTGNELVFVRDEGDVVRAEIRKV